LGIRELPVLILYKKIQNQRTHVNTGQLENHLKEIDGFHEINDKELTVLILADYFDFVKHFENCRSMYVYQRQVFGF
jgi:hypothetical protein